jgi:hypothetical protein
VEIIKEKFTYRRRFPKLIITQNACLPDVKIGLKIVANTLAQKIPMVIILILTPGVSHWFLIIGVQTQEATLKDDRKTGLV